MEKSVILIGMPGCGKTTIGRILSRELDLELRDTDAEVVEMSGMSIPDIFSSSGEERFRELETEALKKVLNMEKHLSSFGTSKGTGSFGEKEVANIYGINPKTLHRWITKGLKKNQGKYIYLI